MYTTLLYTDVEQVEYYAVASDRPTCNRDTYQVSTRLGRAILNEVNTSNPLDKQLSFIYA